MVIIPVNMDEQLLQDTVATDLRWNDSFLPPSFIIHRWMQRWKNYKKICIHLPKVFEI